MKQKVSDYIADHIAEWGIRDVFTVTGGGAMHMNDAFGHHPKLHCTYQHHEQACAMAAEAYARMDNRMAAVCVTTGPGATNAITGVLGGWMDSIPMLVFSGQARYATTVAASGLKLRSMGVQECNIVPVVTSITKYAQMIIHPEDIRYHLEKALYMAVNGRPGPVWLDIPLDVQGAVIDTEKLRGYDPQENPKEKPAEISQDIIQQIFYFIHLSHFQERYHLCIQHIIYFRPKLQLYINISKSICSTFQFLYLFFAEAEHNREDVIRIGAEKRGCLADRCLYFRKMSGKTGHFKITDDGMMLRFHHTPLPYLRMMYQFIDAQERSRRHAGLIEQGDDVCRRMFLHPRFYNRLQLGIVFAAQRIFRKPRVRHDIQSHGILHAAEQAVAGRCHSDIVIFCHIDIKRSRCRMFIAHPFRHDTVQSILDDKIFQYGHGRFHHGHIDILPFSRVFAVIERGHQAERGMNAGIGIGNGYTHFDRRLVGIPRDPQQPAHSLGYIVIGALWQSGPVWPNPEMEA